MARKTLADLKGAVTFPTRSETTSWAAVGCDTSMTSIAAVAVGYDGKLCKRVGPFYGEIRWMPEDDYFLRLAQAAAGFNMIHDMLAKMWVLDPTRTYIAFEEPWFYGAVKQQQSEWLKQQAEIAGAFKGGLARYGYKNLYEINNSQWRAVIRRDGIKIRKGPEGKFDIKEWAMLAYGLPDLPDLVASRTGAKIPRPESGYGAKARAIQPNDIYDAAAVCGWMADQAEEHLLISPQ